MSNFSLAKGPVAHQYGHMPELEAREETPCELFVLQGNGAEVQALYRQSVFLL